MTLKKIVHTHKITQARPFVSTRPGAGFCGEQDRAARDTREKAYGGGWGTGGSPGLQIQWQVVILPAVGSIPTRPRHFDSRTCPALLWTGQVLFLPIATLTHPAVPTGLEPTTIAAGRARMRGKRLNHRELSDVLRDPSSEAVRENPEKPCLGRRSSMREHGTHDLRPASSVGCRPGAINKRRTVPDKNRKWLF